VVTRVSGGYAGWWTWAGHKANATPAASLGTVTTPGQRVNDCWIRVREDIDARTWKQAVADASNQLCLPEIDEKAAKGLKFAEALPPRLATATLALRFSDLGVAEAVLAEPTRFVSARGR
jgi:ATP-dependent Lhr-like helicase